MLHEYPYARIAQNTYEINEYDNASLYLLVGKERALLIDTGIGIGDLRRFAEQLAGVPVEVLLTHNHRDHVGNAPLFDRVHISSIDYRMGKMLRPLTAWESRLQYANHTRQVHPQTDYAWSESDLCRFSAADEPEVVPIRDGFVFELGGRWVTCRLCPGHTPGSMVAIDSYTRYLFCGDACNNIIGLGVRPIEGMRHASVEEALAALQRIWNMDFDKAHVYNGHSDFRALGKPLAPEVMPNAIAAMQQVLSGNYSSQKKHIETINADIETTVINGIELQFHQKNIRSMTASSFQ